MPEDKPKNISASLIMVTTGLIPETVAIEYKLEKLGDKNPKQKLLLEKRLEFLKSVDEAIKAGDSGPVIKYVEEKISNSEAEIQMLSAATHLDGDQKRKIASLKLLVNMEKRNLEDIKKLLN